MIINIGKFFIRMLNAGAIAFKIRQSLLQITLIYFCFHFKIKSL
ncbi:hypothetical protein A1OE_447 [Candidatus Endolissoclinum faulkneri L2]|uniref:Uncharacterized protein n=1 Tax=Candidatus Endolissoclinum faulkneri L2 TaxID=1193729 RepID=K7YGA5_9PROT|nr:hypothetical protein A1OE_447 [Candidatus Endolissoclinum faulkneri L2]